MVLSKLCQQCVQRNFCPYRLLGRVAFRHTMLGRYGTMVTVPYQRGSSSVESMAGDIRAAVEAKTGLPLDSFRC